MVNHTCRRQEATATAAESARQCCALWRADSAGTEYVRLARGSDRLAAHVSVALFMDYTEHAILIRRERERDEDMLICVG